MRHDQLPLILAAISLLTLPACTFWNTAGVLRSTCNTYKGVDITRPLERTAYKTQEGKVYMQAPEITYHPSPFLVQTPVTCEAATPLRGVQDTGGYRWICVCDRDLEKFRHLSGPPVRDASDLAYYKIPFDILQKAPEAEELEKWQKIHIGGGELCAPTAVEQVSGSGANPDTGHAYMSRWVNSSKGPLDDETEYSLLFPLVFAASLPLNILDLGLDAVCSPFSLIYSALTTGVE